MRGFLRYSLTILATGTAALGLARLAAQEPSPTVSNFTTVVHGAPQADALILPRVVPPPQRSPGAVSQILPVSATAPKPAVDLLAAPAVPPAWLTAPTLSAPTKLAVIPSGLSAEAPVKPAVAGQTNARPKTFAAARPNLQPMTANKPTVRSWPPAHLVREINSTQETRGVAYFETAPVVPAPAPAVAVPAIPK